MRFVLLFAACLLPLAAQAQTQPKPGATMPDGRPLPPLVNMEPCEFKTKSGKEVIAPCEFDGMTFIRKADKAIFAKVPPAKLPPFNPSLTAPAGKPLQPVAVPAQK